MFIWSSFNYIVRVGDFLHHGLCDDSSVSLDHATLNTPRCAQQKLLLPLSDEELYSSTLFSICKMETTRICKAVEGKSDLDGLHYLTPLFRTGDGKEQIHCCGRYTLFLGREWSPTIHHITSVTCFPLNIIPHWDFKPKCCQKISRRTR